MMQITKASSVIDRVANEKCVVFPGWSWPSQPLSATPCTQRYTVLYTLMEEERNQRIIYCSEGYMIVVNEEE